MTGGCSFPTPTPSKATHKSSIQPLQGHWDRGKTSARSQQPSPLSSHSAWPVRRQAREGPLSPAHLDPVPMGASCLSPGRCRASRPALAVQVLPGAGTSRQASSAERQSAWNPPRTSGLQQWQEGPLGPGPCCLSLCPLSCATLLPDGGLGAGGSRGQLVTTGHWGPWSQRAPETRHAP